MSESLSGRHEETAPDRIRAANDGIILGGSTPFISPSELWRHQSPDHNPTRFVKDGKDETRIIQLGLLGTMWYKTESGELSTFGESHAEFMTEMIAAANSDLQALGLPMIDIEEVKFVAPILKEMEHGR